MGALSRLGVILMVGVALLLAASQSSGEQDKAAEACLKAVQLDEKVLLMEVAVPSDEFARSVADIVSLAEGSHDELLVSAATALRDAGSNAEADFVVAGGFEPHCRALAGE